MTPADILAQILAVQARSDVGDTSEACEREPQDRIDADSDGDRAAQIADNYRWRSLP